MNERSTRRTFLKGMGYGCAAVLGAGAFADVSARRLVLERHELVLPKWDADGFRVAVVSDLHLNDPVAVERGRQAIEMAIAEKPDLIIMPGDFVTASRPRALGNIRPTLEALVGASCPCIGSLGNHDYWFGWHPAVVEQIKGTKLRLLRNEITDVRGVSVAGLEDALMAPHKAEVLREAHLSRSVLALWHEPDAVDDLLPVASLMVAGHSHGGQVCLPGGYAMYAPKGARKYTSGYYPDANVPLYVSRGVGTTGMQYRLFCPPEVSILTLRSDA